MNETRKTAVHSLNFLRRASLACALAFMVSACGMLGEAPPTAIGDPAPVALNLEMTEAVPSQIGGRHAVAGALQASHQVRVAPRVSARITEILAREGDKVRAGAPIVKLDGRELSAKRTQARANVEALQQKLDYLNVQKARIDKLAKQGVAPPSTVDEINVNVLTTSSQLVAAKGVLAEADSAFEDLIVRAPFAGRVNQRFAEVGDFALPSEPLMVLEDARVLKATLSLSSRDANLLRGKRTVPVRIDGTDGIFEAKVTAILASGVGRIPGQRVILELNNAQGELNAGSVLRLDLAEPEDRRVVEIPSSALEARDGWNGVYVVKDGRLLFNWVTLETEPKAGNTVKVLSGLRAGDRVVRSASEARASGLIGRQVTLPGA